MGGHRRERNGWTREGRIYAIPVVAAGLAFALVELLHMREMTNPLGIIVEAVLPFFGALLLFGIGLVLWTSRFGYEAWQVPRVVAWIAGGMAVMALVFLWLLTHQAIRGAHFHHAHFLGVNNLVVGGLAGFVVGSYDVRRKASQRTLEREQNKHAFLEHILRHHILNGMTVILGQAERLSDDGADAEPVELIETRAEEIVDRIEQVRRITGSPGDDDAALVPVDVAGVVLRAVERERERHPAASIDVTVAAEPTVRADGDLSLAVENLIQNGIEHADAESPTVEVHVGRQDDEGVLRIVDGGPGIPEDQRAALLQWDNDGGLVKGPGVGLAVVRVLLDRYEGTIDFRPVEPTGTEAVVALPLGD